MLVLLASNCLCQSSAPASRTPLDVTRGVDQAEYSREKNLAGYTVQERYTLFRRGENTPAALLVVETTYNRSNGKAYRVISESGSWAGKFVLHKILQNEVELSRGDSRQAVLITSRNYDMSVPDLSEHMINGRKCLIVAIVPKRQSPYLLAGKIWVDAETYHPVQLEGEASAEASVWTGRPSIAREYADLEGIPVATHARSTSKQKLLGETVLEIEYENYRLSH